MIAGNLIFIYFKFVKKFMVVYIILGIYPRKVILVGDSAGGNLIAALTILCI
jgi:hypothetical protein